MVIDGQSRAGGTAQDGFADRLAIVEFLVGRSLKGKARQLQGLNQQAVAGLQGQVIDVADIRQAVADLGFARCQNLGRGCREIGRAHGRYELPPQKAKLRTRGQELSLVTQRSKNRGSRNEPT